jgi:SAM-dependent methyltransferase
MPHPPAGSCPICRNSLEPAVYQLRGVPTLDGGVGETREEALNLPVGDVTLCLCGTCGWIGNATFDAARLSYEKFHFSLQHSPAFESFVRKLIGDLRATYDLDGKRVLDVGCGSGDFLRTFARQAPITGLGVDPSIAPGQEDYERGAVTFERGVLEPRHTDLGADLICCRHVLNSMSDPLELLRQIRAAAGGRQETVFYLEVPHADRTFRNDIVWNLAYEHRSWFNETSFRVLCERAGFEILSMGPCWGDEYLGAELRLADAKPEAVAPAEGVMAARDQLEHFARNVQTIADRWSRRLAELHRTDRRVAIWGAGARALLFLHQVDNKDHVGCVVDISPLRQGNYLAHIGVRIDPPDRLVEFRPDLILISNSAFADEIRQQASVLGLSADFEVF